MGAANIALAFMYWGHLGDRPFRVLTRMALISLDKDEPPKYFAGREDLAFALGREVPPEPDAHDESPEAQAARRERTSIFEIVRKAVKVLTDEGVIVSSGDARFNRQATYSLHLSPTQTKQIVGSGKQQVVGSVPQQNVGSIPTDRCSSPNKSLDADPIEHCPLGVDEEEDTSLGIGEGKKSSQATKLRGEDPGLDEDDEILPTLEEQRNQMLAALREAHPEDFLEPTGSDDLW